MMQKWQISSIVKDQTMLLKIKDEMLKEMARFKLLKATKSSKLQRSTAISETIGENYRMLKCLQNLTKSSEYHIQLYIILIFYFPSWGCWRKVNGNLPQFNWGCSVPLIMRRNNSYKTYWWLLQQHQPKRQWQGSQTICKISGPCIWWWRRWWSTTRRLQSFQSSQSKERQQGCP